ncbi:MAG: TIGR02466 family protein [Rhodospirillaceae bacterium]|nr:TIGR02466 family protein [Rhodospirillaceae bacterium]
MDLKLQNDVELWWGTPVFALTWPEAVGLNADLKALILDRRKQSEGVVKSNLGGWHSTDDMLTWPSPAVVTLRKWILEGFRKATQRTSKGQGYSGGVNITCWANVNGHGHANDTHNHPQSAWSGVYYVDVGTPVDLEKLSGFIYFQDPRSGAGMCQDPFGRFGKGRQFNPMNGQMLFFPSWLIHGVRAYHGEGERISVAFNIALLDLM